MRASTGQRPYPDKLEEGMAYKRAKFDDGNSESDVSRAFIQGFLSVRTEA